MSKALPSPFCEVCLHERFSPISLRKPCPLPAASRCARLPEPSIYQEIRDFRARGRQLPEAQQGPPPRRIQWEGLGVYEKIPGLCWHGQRAGECGSCVVHGDGLASEVAGAIPVGVSPVEKGKP